MPLSGTDDHAQWQDEELVARVHQDACGAALAELARRFEDWSGRHVAGLARRLGLPAADLPDARQEAFFFLLDAIRRYDLDQANRPGGCSFRTFVFMTLTSRVQNFVRDRARKEKYIARSAGAADGLGNGGKNGHQKMEMDPAELAERREEEVRLREAFAGLTDEERRLLEAWAERGGLARLAREWGVAYLQVRYRARRVVDKIKEQVRDRFG